MTLWELFRPECPHCDGKGGFMSGYYEPEFIGCECCNCDERNEADPTRVWRWQWWAFHFRQRREARRLDRWVDEQVKRDEAVTDGEAVSSKEG